jgi:nucleotide-binding universal stress UspA family protein
MARTLDREVVAVHAHQGSDSPEHRAELEATCSKLTAPLRAVGVRSRVLIRAGWPATVIDDLQAVERPGLVVLGSRGAGCYHDLHLGSVPLQVLHRARIPVAVVPCPN